jgi:hypothetical protein
VSGDAPKAADRAKGWPLRLRDVDGLRVRLRRQAGNGMMLIPAGAVGTLETAGNGWHLLQFRGDHCKCCGVAPRITRMSWRDFDPIGQETNS